MKEEKVSIKNKYRPTKFIDMKGVDANRKSFMSIIKSTDSDSFLLFGPRGTGKTTFSEIMANTIVKKYNANKMAIKRINVSNETGVDFARGIIEECQYSSMHKCSVYILNEIQMASVSWQNAMLELIEKPPKNTFFILCTTQEEKLDKAVLSRCTKLKFLPLSEEKTIEFINEITDKEDFELSDFQKKEIYKSCFGIPRECLSILGAIKKLKNEEIDEYIKSYRVIDSDEKAIKDLTSELIKRSSMDSAFEILDSIKDNPETIRMAIINYFYRIMVKPYGNKQMKEESRLKASLILDCFKDSVIYSGKAGLALSIYNYYS